MLELGEDRGGLTAWAKVRSDEVERAVLLWLDAHAADAEQRRLLRNASLELRTRRADAGVVEPAVHLPLLVFSAVSGAEAPIGLAVATSLLELGIDLLDHLADRELGPHWKGHSPGLIQLAATGLLSCLPQLAILEIEATPPVRLSLLRGMAEHLVRIGAGQQRDLQLADSPSPDPDAVLEAVIGKTGERRALYAVLGARLAGAGEPAIERYARMGRWLGAARQLGSDLADLLSAEQSRDLAAGARTWPLAWHLARLTGRPREEALDLLAIARTDRAARVEIKARLFASGAIRRAVLETSLCAERARRALDEAEACEPAASALRKMIARASLASPPSS